MKASPGASIAALAEAIGKSRTSTDSALHRLRDAGLAESLDRAWSVLEPAEPKPTPKWTAQRATIAKWRGLRFETMKPILVTIKVSLFRTGH
jgi:hypothetical protein